MTKLRSASTLVLVIAVGLASGLLAAAQDKPAAAAVPSTSPAPAPRPIALQDILAWRSIGAAELSPDGTWFLYRLSPLEGESEMVLRQVAGTKEYRFPIGEAPRYGSAVRTGFSADSKWAAFLSYPGSKEMKALRKDKKKVATTAVLVNLATGEKTEFEKIRGLAFSGDNPGFVALQRYAPESQEKEKEKDKWTGSDLLVRELASGKEVNIGNVAEYAFDKAGARLALLIDAQGQAGNGLQLRDMASGAVSSLDNDKASYKSLAWTEKGEALTVLKGKEDKAYEDKLWSVLAVDGFRDPKGQRKIVYDPAADKSFPEGMTVSPDSAPEWTETFDAVLFGIHEAKKKKDPEKKEGDEAKPGPDAAPAAPAPKAEEIADEDIPDLVIWHGRDKRLQSEQQVQEQRDKTYSYLAEYRVAEKKFFRLADDNLRYVDPAPKGRFAVGQDNQPYELETNLIGRGYQDISVIDMKTGQRSPALKKNEYYFGTLYDGSHFLYYENGHFFTYDMATGKSVNITKDVPASFTNEDDDHNVIKPPDYPVGSTKDGRNVLLSDGWDIWSVPVSGAGQAVNLTVNGAKDKLRYRRLRLDPEEKAIDLEEAQYFIVYGEWTKKAGLARLEKGKPAPTMLLWDDAGFGNLAKAKKAEVYVYARDTYKD
ncbi:MAG: S9 family peptidase, partial [Candidatus Aminicenantales bacterium]